MRGCVLLSACLCRPGADRACGVLSCAEAVLTCTCSGGWLLAGLDNARCGWVTWGHDHI